MLGEVFGGEKKVGLGLPVAILLRMGQIAEGFREFYSQVGPKLARRIKKERDEAFLEYMGDRVEGFLFWRPVTPKVEELCRDGVGCKGGGMADLGPSFPAPKLLHSGSGLVTRRPWQCWTWLRRSGQNGGGEMSLLGSSLISRRHLTWWTMPSCWQNWSYLGDRSQYMTYGGVESGRGNVECEVP